MNLLSIACSVNEGIGSMAGCFRTSFRTEAVMVPAIGAGVARPIGLWQWLLLSRATSVSILLVRETKD